MADYIDWAALNRSSSSPSYESIRDVVTSPRGSFRDIAGKEIMPLLQTGTDPYLQQAINEIVRQGKESKARTMADVTTAAQSRGLTGSSIESGDIAQASYQQELGQQGQIAGMLAQDAASKQQQMVSFLTQAYGLDFQTANSMASELAQLMGQELGRRNDLEAARIAAKGLKDSQPSFMETIAPSLIQATPDIIGLLSDRRAKEAIVKIGQVKDVPFYSFKYKGGTETHIGVMSDEVGHIPGAVIKGDGFDSVDYSAVMAHLQEK